MVTNVSTTGESLTSHLLRKSLNTEKNPLPFSCLVNLIQTLRGTCIHPVRPQGQQTKDPSCQPHFPLPPGGFQGDPRVDEIYKISQRVLGSPTSQKCLENLQSETPRRNPKQTSTTRSFQHAVEFNSIQFIQHQITNARCRQTSDFTPRPLKKEASKGAFRQLILSSMQ